MLLLDGGYFTRLIFPLGSGPISAALPAVRALIDAHVPRERNKQTAASKIGGAAVAPGVLSRLRTRDRRWTRRPWTARARMDDEHCGALGVHRHRAGRPSGLCQGLWCGAPQPHGERDAVDALRDRLGVEGIHGCGAVAAREPDRLSLDDPLSRNGFRSCMRRRPSRCANCSRTPAGSGTTGRRIFSRPR